MGFYEVTPGTAFYNLGFRLYVISILFQCYFHICTLQKTYLQATNFYKIKHKDTERAYLPTQPQGNEDILNHNNPEARREKKSF